MPPVARQGSSALAIELPEYYNGLTYTGGDIIRGSVIRSDGAAATEAILTIRLLGRAEVEITVTHHAKDIDEMIPQSETCYSHYEFFHTNETPTETKLHDRPLRIERNGPNSCPCTRFCHV